MDISMRYLDRGWKKGLLLFYLLILLPFPVAAQKLVAVKNTVDVGKTGYQQPITAVFEFRNKSSRKLKIEKVRPDCNCTTVEYPKGDIGSNEQFQIRMTYDARQLGHFNKQAAVFSNGTKKPLYIIMTGLVLEGYVDVSGTYPIQFGDLLLDRGDLEFDDINRGDQQEQELHIFNNGTRTYQPNLMHLPSYLTATMTPQRLAPNQAGVMKVTLNSTDLHDYGLTQSTVYLAGNPGDKVSPDNEIPVSAVLLPSFAGTTSAQLAYAPKIQLSQEKVDVQFDGKKKKSFVISISNQGRSELDISSLQLFTIGLQVSLGKSKLRPGESTKLKITAIRDELKKVRTRPRILMITNDPQKPKVTININVK